MGAVALLVVRAVVALASLAITQAAQAHEVQTPAWDLPWSFEPWVVACLLVSAFGYVIGLARLWREAGIGRGITKGQAAAFAGGWLSLAVALVSPLDPLGVKLFSAHMLQHELMMVVSAPLMVLARPLAAWTWALPMAARRRVGGWTKQPGWSMFWQAITLPLSAWSMHAVALWAWHAPRLFEAALHDNGVHVLQHVTFLATALLFWWSALRPMSRDKQGAAMAYVFTTMLHTSALGALLTLSPVLWYASYEASASALGLDPIEDQQLGGLVMWVPAGLAYVAAGLVLAMRWIGLQTRPGARARS
jgi:putative membrane protein